VSHKQYKWITLLSN